jgi:hypothetical protein
MIIPRNPQAYKFHGKESLPYAAKNRTDSTSHLSWIISFLFDESLHRMVSKKI